jgi:hypothetical protein
MKNRLLKLLIIAISFLGLALTGPVMADDNESPDKPEAQSEATQAVQTSVAKEAEGKTAEQRKRILAEASAAIAETRKALKALDEKKPDDALKALELATGKLALIVARDPDLALAPVDVRVTSYDIYAKVETIEEAIKKAEDYLEDGEVQKARHLVANLASEIVIETVNIPLATYPDAILEVAPLIDEGKLEEARRALQMALNTLVVVEEEVLPLPVVRAESILKKAEKLAEKQGRSEKDNKQLESLLDEAQTQLKIAQLLGYGDKKAFKPMYEQLDEIRKKTEGGKHGKGFFDKIKQQISNFLADKKPSEKDDLAPAESQNEKAE